MNSKHLSISLLKAMSVTMFNIIAVIACILSLSTFCGLVFQKSFTLPFDTMSVTSSPNPNELLIYVQLGNGFVPTIFISFIVLGIFFFWYFYIYKRPETC